MSVPLSTLSQEHWGNSILWRLAVALGMANDGDGEAFLDPDIIVKTAEDYIFAYRDLRES